MSSKLSESSVVDGLKRVGVCKRTTAEELFAAAERLGIQTMSIRFFGGHDEGHLDQLDIRMVSPQGRKCLVSLSERDFPELYDLVSRPIEDEFGGFCSCPDTEGQVIWDVKRRTVRLCGEQMEPVPFEKVWDYTV